MKKPKKILIGIFVALAILSIPVGLYWYSLPPSTLATLVPDPPRDDSDFTVTYYDSTGEASPLPDMHFDVVYKDKLGQEVRVPGTKFIDNCESNPAAPIPIASLGTTFKCGGYYYIPELKALYFEQMDTISLVARGSYESMEIPK